MGDKPGVLEWGDLAAKLLLPVVIAAATLWYNAKQDARKHLDDIAKDKAAEAQRQADVLDKDRQTCIDLQIKLVSAACTGKDCEMATRRDNQVVAIGQLLNRICEPVGLSLTQAARSDLLKASLNSTDAGTSAAGQQAAGVAAPIVTVAPANTKAVPQSIPEGGASEAGVNRVYIQFADKSQKAGAEAVRKHLTESTFNGHPLAAPGVQQVAQAPAHTELRCFKAVDCATAPQLGAYIAGYLGQPVAVTDLHRRYESVAAVKPGSFELWFGPGPVLLSGSSGGSF